MTASGTGEPGDCRQQKQKRTARSRTALSQQDRGTRKNACGFWNSPCTSWIQSSGRRLSSSSSCGACARRALRTRPAGCTQSIRASAGRRDLRRCYLPTRRRMCSRPATSPTAMASSFDARASERSAESAVKAAIYSPVSRPHTRTERSREHDTAHLPSRVKATSLIFSE